MSQPSNSSVGPGHHGAAGSQPAEPPTSVFLVPYPKIVFLYPTLLLALIAAITMSFITKPLEASDHAGSFISILFLGLFAVNLVILAFDFPRTTSLTLFFFAMAVVMGVILLFKYKPDIFPVITAFLAKYHPLANATFYWSFAGILGAMFVMVFFVVRFDYWKSAPTRCCITTGS